MLALDETHVLNMLTTLIHLKCEICPMKKSFVDENADTSFMFTLCASNMAAYDLVFYVHCNDWNSM